MQVNKYLFCGCSVELKSDDPIEKEREFSAFLSEYSDADYSIRIIRTDELPPKTGEAVYLSDRRKVYYDGRTKLYTAYFNTKEYKYIDYACKIDNSELYIKSTDRFGEITVFDSLNLPAILIEKGIGILHCSFIEYKGYAILFSGDKQVGKSTQAALWNENLNTETINGDRAALSVENGVVYANGIPFCGTSKICKNRKLPVKAIICLSKGTENKIKRLSASDAFMSVIGKFTYDMWDNKASETIADLVQTVAETVPVYSYSCLKDKTAVDFLEKELSAL